MPCIVALVVCLACCSTLSAQQIGPLLRQEPHPDGSAVSFGMDKIANTYVWTGNADVTLPIPLGSVRWVNTYRGVAFRTSSVATRDDENSFVDITIPVLRYNDATGDAAGPLAPQPLSVVLRQGFILSRDSRNLGLSSLERLNGGIGLRYQADTNIHAEVITAIEATSQLGARAVGQMVGGEMRIDRLSIDDWTTTARVLADWQRVDERRTNADAIVTARISRMVDDGALLNVDAGYTELKRDFLTQLSSVAPLVVEARNEHRLALHADLTYPLRTNLLASVTADLQANSITRQFGVPTENNPTTFVSRALGEFMADVAAEIRWALPTTDVAIGVGAFSRDENNGVLPVFDIPDVELAALRQQEVQRDNATLRTRSFVRAEWRPSDADTLRADVSGYLLRYDTPSDLNQDDRDELMTIASVTAARRVNDVLAASLTLSGQMVHVVFLKSERSAQNNVNNVIRLTPSLRITGRVVSMAPVCEVLANYTVYDYETSSSVRSFSFRQLSYRDSMRVRISDVHRAETQLLVRYFERASLNWQSFAENPQTGNTEYLAKILIFSDVGTAWSVGAGMRWYALEQRSLDIAGGASPLPTSSVRFWAPETAIRYRAPGGSTLSVSGWYEFQTVNFVSTRRLPNLLLQAHIQL